MTDPAVAPVDPDIANEPDADLERRIRERRKRLAEGGMSPAKRRMLEAEQRADERTLRRAA